MAALPLLPAMNRTSPPLCGVGNYLSLCASSKVMLLVPGLGLNILILLSLVSSLLSRQRKIKSNVAVFILGSTVCNLLNLCLWPMTIHWKRHGRWLLGSQWCEFMVLVKDLTSSTSFLYISFITFSIYLTVVCGCRRLVNSRLLLVLELLFPPLCVGLKEMSQWLSGSRVRHLDAVNLSCFSFINDRITRFFILVKNTVFLPLNLYFYAHILYTLVQSAKVLHRSQKVNVNLAKVFGLISLITFVVHVPGAVFSLVEQPSVCHEMTRDFLLDLPLLSSPIILLCMNKELRSQCVSLIERSTNHQQGKSINSSEEHRRALQAETQPEEL